MKYKTSKIIFAVVGMTLLFLQLNSAASAYDNISDFILKVNPGAQASAIPEDFLRSGSDDEYGYAYEGYIDGYKIICRAKNGRVKSVHAQKEFNTADLSTQHAYNNILGNVLVKLMKKYNGTLFIEKGRGESTDKMPYEFGEYCYYTALRGEGKTIKTKEFNLGFWFDLGIWKRCDNDKYNSSNSGKVIIEFKPAN
ncbi:MAG: hypothetical protein CVU52_01340 [Deltaproteobacteria bacterium HGW-Deltaproteobacteria-10]|nr:MAG: hypothetical protein CVU52_01340 [Deltaproteobacteria bacterium HGW-Deltaproteobacteria-10]